jgi:hypothetical protein
MGRSAPSAWWNYVGLFDDLSVFNRELSAPEVKALHQLKVGVKSLKP